MRNLKSEDIEILDKIAKTKPTNILSCCDLLTDIFEKDRSAIIVDDRAYLLKAQGVEKDVLYAILLSFISLITEARDEGYVYLIPSFTQTPFFLQRQASREIYHDDGAMKCAIGVISKVTDESIKLEGDIDYEGEILPSTIFNVLTSGVYCTEKLRKLKNDNYQTEEDLRYKKELCMTRIGLGISLFALFVSLVSPFWMTEYNNCHAYSTMDTTQFKIITGKLDSTRCIVVKETDSHLEKTDSVSESSDSTNNMNKKNENSIIKPAIR